MAIRQQTVSQVAGLSEWVVRREALKIARQLGGLSTIGELADWSRKSDMAPLLRSRAGRAFVSVEIAAAIGVGSDPSAAIADTNGLVRVAILSLASSRRHHAVRDLAKSQRLGLSVALGTDQRSLLRCPACDAPVGDVFDRIHCEGCLREQNADLSGLLRTTSKAPKRRSASGV